MTIPWLSAATEQVLGLDRLRGALGMLVEEQRQLDQVYCDAVTAFADARDLTEDQRQRAADVIHGLGSRRASLHGITHDLVAHCARRSVPALPADRTAGRPGAAPAATRSTAEPDIVAACREVFTAHGDPSALATAVLVRALRATSGPAWGRWQRDDLTARGLSNLLTPYGIRPGNVRLPDGSRRKGYRRGVFTDALRHHCPDLSAGPMPATRWPRAAA
ncbi:Protein of unknown function DUF3631 [Actinobacteria bacterium OK074]|nr:Protein of unknown function DUF3631 [Actinobacteria bacterium OK074]